MSGKDISRLTDVAYWDRAWSGRETPAPLDPDAPGLNGTLQRSLHRFFTAAFGKIGASKGDSILEAGAGGSVILPYFRSRFGLQAEGIENSPVGAELSRAIAEASGIQTPIHHGDLFDPPAHLLQRYDVVFSYGLVEHFRPTTLILDALARIARPEGHLLTIIPNMRGSVGFLQKLANPAVYEVHVPLNVSELVQAHEACGMRVINSGYLMTVNFGVINFTGARPVAAAIGPRLSSWSSKLVWQAERLGFPEFPNATTSPYIFVIARKRKDAGR